MADENTPATFTQADIDKVKKEAETQTKKLQDELSALSQKVTLTADERTALKQRLEELETSKLTDIEKLKRQNEKLAKEYNEHKETTTKALSTWQNRYNTAAVSRDLTDAAVKHGAYNTQQIQDLLGAKSTLVEVKDSEGNPTGELAVRVRLPKDGKTLELTADEAVKMLSEDDGYVNLFKKSGVGGLGSQNKGKVNLTEAQLSDPATYRKNRSTIVG